MLQPRPTRGSPSDGATVRDKLNRETHFGVEEAVLVTTEIADALAYAHRNDAIHRDIKPENILRRDRDIQEATIRQDGEWLVYRVGSERTARRVFRTTVGGYAVADHDHGYVAVGVRSGWSPNELLVVENFFEELEKKVGGGDEPG